jgi:hypothetical protein
MHACACAYTHIHYIPRRKKLSLPSELVTDHQYSTASLLCISLTCWSGTVIRSDIHNVSCCRLTSCYTPTYHNRDQKYCILSQENPVWKNPWQVLIFCTSGGLPNPHLCHAMGSATERNWGLLKMKNNWNKLHYWHLSFCHLIWYKFTTISEKNVFFDQDSMFIQNVGKCIPHSHIHSQLPWESKILQ